MRGSSGHSVFPLAKTPVVCATESNIQVEDKLVNEVTEFSEYIGKLVGMPRLGVFVGATSVTSNAVSCCRIRVNSCCLVSCIFGLDFAEDPPTSNSN